MYSIVISPSTVTFMSTLGVILVRELFVNTSTLIFNVIISIPVNVSNASGEIRATLGSP